MYACAAPYYCGLQRTVLTEVAKKHRLVRLHNATATGALRRTRALFSRVLQTNVLRHLDAGDLWRGTGCSFARLQLGMAAFLHSVAVPGGRTRLTLRA
jgi:hypothetical protein